MRICFTVATPMTVNAFLTSHLRALSDSNDVSLVVNLSGSARGIPDLGLTNVWDIPIERSISPLRDLRALWRLFWLYVRNPFDAVHSVTPKAGLLAMLAATLARVPVRIHTFTGQVWVTRSGVSRWGLKMLDRLMARLATHVLVDSPSQRQFLMDEGVVKAQASTVLSHGSISGVDLCRFRPNLDARREIRHELGVPDQDVMILFVGRQNRDKGVLDLARAFSLLSAECPAARLCLVGPDEEGLHEQIEEICASCLDRLHVVGQTDRPEAYMAASDLFCLPSYREGFGSVIIEAAAAGIPAVGSRIYGVSDAIEDGVSGRLFECGNVAALREVLVDLVRDEVLRQRMAKAARERAEALFSSEHLSQMLVAYYADLGASRDAEA